MQLKSGIRNYFQKHFKIWQTNSIIAEHKKQIKTKFYSNFTTVKGQC